jgi:hypothetical protein
MIDTKVMPSKIEMNIFNHYKYNAILICTRKHLTSTLNMWFDRWYQLKPG